MSVAGSPKSVKKLSSGSLLIEVERPKHAENLMKFKQFFQIPAKCSPHGSLNTTRSIIRCPDLAGVSEAEIVEELSNQHVTAARRITVFRDGIKRETNTIVLTSNSAILPKSLKVGYLNVGVDLTHFNVTLVTNTGITDVDVTKLVRRVSVDIVVKPLVLTTQ